MFKILKAEKNYYNLAMYFSFNPLGKFNFDLNL